MILQYITDRKGIRKFVQVQIPIQEWEKAGETFVIEKNDEEIYTAADYRKAAVMRGNKILAKSLENYEG